MKSLDAALRRAPNGLLLLPLQNVLANLLSADPARPSGARPHAEGLADPLSFVDDLAGFSPAEIRLVMRENVVKLMNT